MTARLWDILGLNVSPPAGAEEETSYRNSIRNNILLKGAKLETLVACSSGQIQFSVMDLMKNISGNHGFFVALGLICVVKRRRMMSETESVLDTEGNTVIESS